MKEVFKGIYQIPLFLKSFSPGGVNVYLIRDTNGYTLIDTGWGALQSVQSLETQLQDINVSFQDIRRIILTHFHLDHLGMMGKFKEQYHSSIYIHAGEMELMRIRYGSGDAYWPMTDNFLRTHGMPDSVLIPPEYPTPSPAFLAAPDVLLRGNESIRIGQYSFRVIHTPGHSPGHIVLYEANSKLLLSGDVLLPTIVTNAGSHVQHIHNPIQQYLNSLDTLANLEVDLILPGHENPFSDHRQRIAEIKEHYRQKREAAWEALQNHSEPLTAFEVAGYIPYVIRTRYFALDQLGRLDQRFAVLQAIAILEELSESLKIRIIHKDDKVYYQRT